MVFATIKSGDPTTDQQVERFARCCADAVEKKKKKAQNLPDLQLLLLTAGLLLAELQIIG